MTGLDVLLLLAVAALVALPPRLDPAIRLKEWNAKRREDRRVGD